MPLLKPFDPQDSFNPIEEILEDGGIQFRHHPEYSTPPIQNEVDSAEVANILSTSAKKKGPVSESEKLRKVLNRSGASVENASKTIAEVLSRSKQEHTKLKAAELILDLHGMRDKDGGINKQPVFQFMIKDSTVNLNSIFAPVRQTKESLEQEESENY